MTDFKLIFTAGFGTFFESFDFYLFSLFSIALNYSFFGSINRYSVKWIFIIFAVGYFARILGALIFGYYGDKVGRIFSFKKTIILMAITSILIGFLPSYHMVGIFSVIILMILRFIQGISFGGELSGATIVIVERFNKYQSIIMLFLIIITTIGVFTAKGFIYLLSFIFSHQDMMDYGWRIAYIFGGIMVFHSYFTRKEITDSCEFEKYRENFDCRRNFKLVLNKYKYLIVY